MDKHYYSGISGAEIISKILKGFTFSLPSSRVEFIKFWHAI